METFKTNFGADHPDTLTSIANLAFILGKTKVEMPMRYPSWRAVSRLRSEFLGRGTQIPYLLYLL